MPVDPTDSALDAVAAYFGGLTGIASAQRGFPEHAASLDLRAGPVATITFVDDQRTPVSPGLLNTAKPFLWRTAELRVVAQLDLWAPYRAQRDAAARIIEAALDNDLPFRTGLYLASAGYHGRPLTVTASASDGRNIDEDAAATEGEWRRMWTLEVITDLVAETDTPAQYRQTLRPTVGGVTDPDTDVVP